MSTIHDPRYSLMIEKLVLLRNEQKMTQIRLAELLRKPQSFISKVERLERRLDVIELIDWLVALKRDPIPFMHDLITPEG